MAVALAWIHRFDYDQLANKIKKGKGTRIVRPLYCARTCVLSRACAGVENNSRRAIILCLQFREKSAHFCPVVWVL
jgi:hypothetical protein